MNVHTLVIDEQPAICCCISLHAMSYTEHVFLLVLQVLGRLSNDAGLFIV